MEPQQIVELLKSGGVLAFAALLIYAGVKEWYVWGPSAKRVLDREIARADRAEAERDRMHVVVEERVVPALTESIRVNSVTTEKVEDLIREVAELKGTRGSRR